ncbi:MerR family transcriptional regulator [Roseofilum reptotaenium CS-1145]|uniref:MerR family transcriptional regulator n=1 Tax=Roseofilum reptotaenium AO1-A TaxID=1925591 RepID=A0A1L9QRE1_9CYAN|nr:MerR family transcriptional regulator [Roseofilum reptotaenium]MDB9519887.1 MerR family transcriptional regulator [Roseofilum reptotaenium CS-1145]OJJ25196.1 MerR family transcriptional regulator [Roseofilum reptotaenium AO1-A]
MKTLQQLSREQPLWSLEEFAQVLNELLPQFLPDQKSHSRRSREEVNPRLVRHYASQGLLDEPLKQGRRASYTYRHLLQMLLIRRLLSEGFGISAMQSFVVAKTNTELESLLQGGIQLSLEPANPALAFLQQVKERSPEASPPNQRNLSPPSQKITRVSEATQSAPEDWKHLEILPGLEIHLRSDVTLPTSPQEQENLVQAIAQALLALRYP